MTRIYDIANDYVERFATLNPVAATSLGKIDRRSSFGSLHDNRV